jgi:DnaJ-domain-containing protein 1
MVRLFILFLIVYSAIRVARQIIAALEASPGTSQRQGGARPTAAPPPPPPSRAREPRPPTPWDVLGVSPNASQQEIKRAYQALVRQYHPDKVGDLGVELRELAEQRTKVINAAYNQLKRSF